MSLAANGQSETSSRSDSLPENLHNDNRMPQLGRNQSVEQACETFIRAHEMCVVTLST